MKKLAHYKKEANTLRAVERRMDSSGETQVSLMDPDARDMATTSKQPRVAPGSQMVLAETSRGSLARLSFARECYHQPLRFLPSLRHRMDVILG